ncbi:MAG: MerR family transcriptional regulator [Bacteroidetes bacterium]|nr:MerR family transcriptional regulator [Bacteroidota bacterium]MBP6402419.1 MerR family transcriptional regulator [Bacteroidia bacterium]
MQKANLFRSLKSKYFDDRPFSLKDCGATHRELTYWDTKGLLPVQVDAMKWRRFNLTELVWLRFIARLRQFNVGLNVIALVKAELFFESPLSEWLTKEAKEKALEQLEPLPNGISKDSVFNEDFLLSVKNIFFSTFEMLLMQILHTGESISIIISIEENSKGEFKEGYEIHVLPLLLDQLQIQVNNTEIQSILRKNYISISLNHLFEEVICLGRVEKVGKLFELSEKEEKVLEYLRENRYKSIEVTFNDGQPKLLLATEELKASPNVKLIDLIINGAYEDIKVITENGLIVHLEKKSKIKL